VLVQVQVQAQVEAPVALRPLQAVALLAQVAVLVRVQVRAQVSE
jgi:hypothetical protein